MFILFYHLFVYIGILFYKDFYVKKLLDDMITTNNKLNYNKECIKEIFEAELIKSINKSRDLLSVFIAITSIFIDTIIIPIIYDTMQFVLLVRYLIMYKKDELTEFEYIYSIILCSLIGMVLCCFVCVVVSTKVLKVRINRN